MPSTTKKKEKKEKKPSNWGSLITLVVMSFVTILLGALAADGVVPSGAVLASYILLWLCFGVVMQIMFAASKRFKASICIVFLVGLIVAIPFFPALF